MSSPENPLRLSAPAVWRPLQEEPPTVHHALKPSSGRAAENSTENKTNRFSVTHSHCNSFKVKGLQSRVRTSFRVNHNIRGGGGDSEQLTDLIVAPLSRFTASFAFGGIRQVDVQGRISEHGHKFIKKRGENTRRRDSPALSLPPSSQRGASSSLRG